MMWWEPLALAAMSCLIYYQIGAIGRDLKMMLHSWRVDAYTHRAQHLWVWCVCAWFSLTFASWLLFQTGVLQRDYFEAALQEGEAELRRADDALARYSLTYKHIRGLHDALRAAIMDSCPLPPS